MGCRRIVWADDGSRQPWEKESRACALSGSARFLIETCQPDFQPVGGRLVNHSRLRESLDKAIGTRPAGSWFLVNPLPGLWEVVGAAGFQAAVGRGWGPICKLGIHPPLPQGYILTRPGSRHCRCNHASSSGCRFTLVHWFTSIATYIRRLGRGAQRVDEGDLW